MKSVGLALGSGGTRGLAHILVLEIFDEYGIRPVAISGCSIGAIMGALYASGLSAEAIRNHVDESFLVNRNFRTKKDIRSLKKDHEAAMQMVRFLDIDFRGTGLIKGKNFTRFLEGTLEKASFEELNIPLTVVATDFQNSSEVVFRDGPLIPAIRASMSVPGLFTPMVYQNRLLIDGSCVNPVPWDLLPECDISIAVNVLGHSTMSAAKIPKAGRAIFEAFDVLQRSNLTQRLRYAPPDLLLTAPIHNVGLLDLIRLEEIYKQSAVIADELRRFLDSVL